MNVRSKDWEDIFPNVAVNKLPREISDHNPLILFTDNTQLLKYLEFRFETAWLSHPDFIEKVQEIWNKNGHAESALDRIQTKLKRFKQYFKGWGFNLQGARRKRKSEIHDILKELEDE